MNEEELTYRIPNNQIHISKEKDEDCLIWISQKAINMANTIEELQQENKKYKDVIDKAINNSQYWIDYYTRLNSDERIALRLQENIDILKEVK